jgi:CreA protein
MARLPCTNVQFEFGAFSAVGQAKAYKETSVTTGATSRIAALACIGAMMASTGLCTAAQAQERIGAVSTTFRVIGPNDKVVVDRYDDPKVENAACYVSRAETGGISGAVGLAEDPSRFSIACRAVGPLRVVGDIDKSKNGELVFSERTSAVFKAMHVTRFFDKTKNVLVYLVTSTKIVEGSPFNSISVVPLAQ